MSVPPGHEDHGSFVLSLTEEGTDGSQVHQSWELCKCSLPRMRTRLGPPDYEAVASPDAVDSIAAHVEATAGNVYQYRGEEQ